MSKKSGLLGNNNLAERLKIAKAELADTLNSDNNSAKNERHEHSDKIYSDPHKENIQKNNKTATKKKNLQPNIDPKLYVSGRFNRKEHDYISKAFYIQKNLDEQIKTYCRGTDITVYNYLISIGLDVIKQLTGMKTADASEVEEKYSST